MALRLANDDITKLDSIYEMNYIGCLNVLAYWHEKDLYMEGVNRKNNLKYGK